MVAPADHEALVMDVAALRQQEVPRELGALEAYLANLKRVSDEVMRFSRDTERQPWTRIHAELVHSGLWASLKSCSRSVYMVLAALSDRRKRVTIAGVEMVARLSGLSVPRTLFAYKELRDRGLIWRRRIRLGEKQPYLTGLCNPGRWKQAPVVPRSRPF
jgi:hypothetical protein